MALPDRLQVRLQHSNASAKPTSNYTRLFKLKSKVRCKMVQPARLAVPPTGVFSARLAVPVGRVMMQVVLTCPHWQICMRVSNRSRRSRSRDRRRRKVSGTA